MQQKHLVFLLEVTRQIEISTKKRRALRLKEVVSDYNITPEDLDTIIKYLMDKLINESACKQT